MSDQSFDKLLCQAKPLSFRLDMVLAILFEPSVKEKDIFTSTSPDEADPWQPKRETRRPLRLPKWASSNWDDFRVQNGIPQMLDVNTKEFRGIAPDFKIGDLRYIKETVGYLNTGKYDRRERGIFYRADHRCGHHEVKRWRGSRFMPKDDARLIVKITDVRLERLHDITEEDAIREGARLWAEDSQVNWLEYKALENRKHECQRYTRIIDQVSPELTARGCFGALWNTIHGKTPEHEPGSYNYFASPVVQVVRFEIAAKREGAFR